MSRHNRFMAAAAKNIQSLFLSGYAIKTCLSMAAAVALSGCSTPAAKKPVAAHSPAPAPSSLVPQARGRISQAVAVQPSRGITVPYGSVLEVDTATNGATRFQDIGPLPVDITNCLPRLTDGQFGISGVTWSPNDADVVVWVHEDNFEDWLGEGPTWGNQYHWTLWASPGLDTRCWIEVDCKDTLGAADVQFDGGSYNPQQCLYRVTRE